MLGRERALPYALLPTVAGTALTLLNDLPPWSGAALLPASLAAATVVAVRATRRPAATGPHRARRPARRARARTVEPAARARLLASLPYGVFGLGAGTLVLYTALGDELAGRPGAVVAAPPPWR
ncbi:hypothetical protein ACH4D4_12070 [Streptomyces pristinaespiralis]|uniref:hypothetical protein n=1 Tax=Streptomyces pristinaespiralis TaxID=38300 RepID=UPI0037A807BE